MSRFIGRWLYVVLLLNLGAAMFACQSKAPEFQPMATPPPLPTFHVERFYPPDGAPWDLGVVKLCDGSRAIYVARNWGVDGGLALQVVEGGCAEVQR